MRERVDPRHPPEAAIALPYLELASLVPVQTTAARCKAGARAGGVVYFGKHLLLYRLECCFGEAPDRSMEAGFTASMPHANFMLEDLAGALRAIGLFPLFLLIPGYAVAWAADLFEFRGRSVSFRVAVSVPLSVAVCPILTYLAGHLWGNAVWLLYGLLAGIFCFALARSIAGGGLRREGRSRNLRPFALAMALWLIVEVFSLVDLQIGQRLYYPVSSIDTAVRAEFVHSVSTSGIPPANPFFLPGQPAPLRYHYFWPMMCSLVERASGRSVSARQAIIGGTFWAGIGLMGLIALYLRLFFPAGEERLQRRCGVALLLAAVTGLDILPSLGYVALYCNHITHFLPPSVEWWNEHVDWFIYTAFWAPHALAAMLACFMGFLLLWKAPETRGRRSFWSYAVLAGVALASSAGTSIYVTFVFAIFLMVWTGIAFWKKWTREAAGLAAAGAIAVALALPYLAELREPAAATFGGGAPLQFTIRAFTIARMLGSVFSVSPGIRPVVLNLPLLPLNYLLELGVFFAAWPVWWRMRRGRPLSRQELACTVMVATSILICTFLKSSVIGCNDLGWRGFLIAEFILLLVAAEVLAKWKTLLTKDKVVLGLFLALGAVGSVYDLAITRTYPVLADAGVVPPLDWMSPDRHFGERNYAFRAAYEWASAAAPENAIIQFNPKVVFQETPEMLYASRRVVASDPNCNTTFGGDPRKCGPLVSRIDALFQPVSSTTPRQACAVLPMQIVVAKDTDDIWKNRESWVWKETPAFANDYIRMFLCRPPAEVTLRSGLVGR